MSNRIVPGVALALLALLGSGCGAKQAVLPHAVYANSIPVYPGAELEDMMGSTSMGDTPESTSEGMSWSFRITAPADKMLAFYERKVPQAKRDPDWEFGIHLAWTPEGAEPGEQLEVFIENNRLSIRESVKPGKRPGNPNAWSQDMASGLSGAVGGSGDD